MTFTSSDLQQALTCVPQCQHFLVGLSGGLDSVVLLHALWQLRNAHQINQLVSAVHINHGLNQDAGEWQSFCEKLCARWEIPLETRPVHVPQDGSLENNARNSRYEVFAELSAAHTVLLLAHHLDDQLETLLLRLLRGAGTTGLIGMPRQRTLGEGQLLRPLLDFSRAELQDYARREELKWVEDSSNSELHHDRNFLRQQVLPMIEQRWPRYRESWSKSLSLLTEAADMLQVMAQDDLDQITGQADRLQVRPLLKLSEARQRQVLRYWLAQLHLTEPGWNQLQQLVQQVLQQEEGTGRLELEDCYLQVHSGELYALRKLPQLDAAEGTQQIQIQPQARLLAGNGFLNFQQLTGAGLKSDYQQLDLRYRQGGESLHLPGRPAKSLKKLFQESAIPPWLRDRVPLLFHGDDLVCVPGIGIAEQATAGEQEPGYEVSWQPPEVEIHREQSSPDSLRAPV
jgi:tRNA(Ile)-lysidine synthase